MRPTVLQLLIDTRARLEKSWIKNYEARNRNGPVGPLDPTAKGWCMIGALQASNGRQSEHDLRYKRAYRYIMSVINNKKLVTKRPAYTPDGSWGSISAFNDSGKIHKADVLQVMDLAIERCRKRTKPRKAKPIEILTKEQQELHDEIGLAMTETEIEEKELVPA